MTTQQLFRSLVSFLLVGTLLVPAFASAQSLTTAAAAGVSTSVASTTVTVHMSAAAMAKAKSRADQELTRRLSALSDLSNRVNAMQSITSTFKQDLTTAIQNQASALTTLKSTIDADTNPTTLKSEIQSITSSYRIYALVLPQIRIAAQADREVTIAAMMSTLGSKLQARITALSNSGATVGVLTNALADLSTQIQNATTQAQTAVTATASLQPDNGNKTVMASNTATLKTGRTDLQTGQADLVAARKDITTIIQGLKTIKSPNAAATTTTTTTTQTTTGH